jgi:hypothetical protein
MENFPKTHEEFFKLTDNKKRFLQFIKDKKLFKTNNSCIKSNSYQNYNNLLFVNDRLILRCNKCKQCRSAKMHFFNKNKDSRLSMIEILSILWYWSHNCSNEYTSTHTETNKSTVGHWFNKIRSTLYKEMLKAPKLGGESYTVQIGESLFQGKRKYNRGRLLRSDKGKTGERNYGKRVSGPWVFGMVCPTNFVQQKSTKEKSILDTIEFTLKI